MSKIYLNKSNGSIKLVKNQNAINLHATGRKGLTGDKGLSAYEVAVANGFVGTEAEWLNSLKGGGTGSSSVTSVNGRQGDVIGLAEQTDLAAHTSNITNPHTVTKAQVGLANVPNTDFTSAVNANTAKRSYPLVDETKLAGIATGATANATDAQLRDRATHTGSQTIATVTGLQTALDSKSATTHAHAINDLSNTTITTPADGEILTYDGVAAQWKNATAPAGGGGGGGLPYDIIVAADGSGTHTTLDAALTAATDNQSIFIKAGTYTLTAAISSLAIGLKIHGENKTKTTIALDSFTMTIKGGYSELKNLTLTMTSGYFHVDGTNEHFLVDNCIILASPTGQYNRSIWAACNYSTMTNCYFEVLVQQQNHLGIILNGEHTRATNSTFYGSTIGLSDTQLLSATYVANCLFRTKTSQNGSLIDSGANPSIIKNNTFIATGSYGGKAINARNMTMVEGNEFRSIQLPVTGLLAGSSFMNNHYHPVNNVASVGCVVNGELCRVEGNIFGDPTNTNTAAMGVSVRAGSAIVSGNSFRGLGTNVEVQATVTKTLIANNSSLFSSTNVSDAGTGTVQSNNMV